MSVFLIDMRIKYEGCSLGSGGTLGRQEQVELCEASLVYKASSRTGLRKETLSYKIQNQTKE